MEHRITLSAVGPHLQDCTADTQLQLFLLLLALKATKHNKSDQLLQDASQSLKYSSTTGFVDAYFGNTMKKIAPGISDWPNGSPPREALMLAELIRAASVQTLQAFVPALILLLRSLLDSKREVPQRTW